jgi:hypothetical protein
MEFANLYIAYKGQEAEGSRVETPLGGTSAEMDYIPDQRLVTTLNLGTAPDSTESGEATTPSDTDPDESTPTGTTPGDTEPTGKKGCGSALVTPALLMLMAAGYALCCRKDRST